MGQRKSKSQRWRKGARAKELKNDFRQFKHGMNGVGIKLYKYKGLQLPYTTPLKVDTLNIKVLNRDHGIRRRQHIGDVTKEEDLNIFLLAETQVDTSSTETLTETSLFLQQRFSTRKNWYRTLVWELFVVANLSLSFMMSCKPAAEWWQWGYGQRAPTQLLFVATHCAEATQPIPRNPPSESLQMLLQDFQDAVYIRWRFQCRIQQRYSSEQEILRSFIFGRGRACLEEVAHAKKENSDPFDLLCWLL